MPKLFGVNIAGLLHKSLSPGMFPGRLIVGQDGVRDSNNPTEGLHYQIVSVITFRGIAQGYTDDEIDGELILKEDRKFLIIAESLEDKSVIPGPGMKIELDNTPGTWLIIRAKRDPASATYLCQARI